MLGNNANIDDDGYVDATIGDHTSMELPSSGEIIFDASPITFDYADSAAAEEFGTPNLARSLHDLVSSNSYRLRRLVGKIYAHWLRADTDDQVETAPIVDFASGFMVCRTNDLGTPTTDFSTVNPLHQDSANDPWIWRRRWLLGGSPASAGINYAGAVGLAHQAAQKWPQTTAGYGSVADGPHFDAKTARVIGGEQRLFWVNAARTLGATLASPGIPGPSNLPVFLHILLDVRALASLRFGSGNRRNASR